MNEIILNNLEKNKREMQNFLKKYDLLSSILISVHQQFPFIGNC